MGPLEFGRTNPKGVFAKGGRPLADSGLTLILSGGKIYHTDFSKRRKHDGTFGIWTNKSERDFCERRKYRVPKALKKGEEIGHLITETEIAFEIK
jgi:hypothetical protein